jgi:exonuclease SbcD
MTVRILFLADTHLGFDLPVSPRVRRRRRGHDFLANYHRALDAARTNGVDLVVHGGDVFHSPRVPPSLVYQAFEPLIRLAGEGIPVFVVPGNHERSRIPHGHLSRHPGIRTFDRPRTYDVDVRGCRVALAGFPYARKVRDAFPSLMAHTGFEAGQADVALLCAHQCFAGATVGPVDFMFRAGPDVVQVQDIPAGFAAVLSGHVHRHQVLTSSHLGQPLAAPVLYPGSVERTAFAEMNEEKGYLIVDLQADERSSGGSVAAWRFEPLPARPMIMVEVSGHGLAVEGLARVVQAAVRRSPVDAVLRLRVRGSVSPEARAYLSAARVRAMAPPEMNLEVQFDGDRSRRGRVRQTHREIGSPMLMNLA